MDYVDGGIFWELDLPGLQPAERGRIYDDMNRVLATLHTLDYAALGLGDYRRLRRWRNWAGASPRVCRRHAPRLCRAGCADFVHDQALARH